MTDTYRARYWRYSKQGEEECASLDEAIAFLANGLDQGEVAAIEVVGPDGAVALGSEDLQQRMMAALGV